MLRRIKDMSVGKEEEKLEAYNEEDQKLLVSLLNEYAEKMALSCEKIEKSIALQERRCLNAFTMMLLIVLFGFLIYLLETNYNLEVFLLINAYAFSKSIVVPILTTLIVSMSIALVSSGINVLNISFKTNMLIHDAKILSKKLEKVVQIVSQMQEHSVKRIASRIEMDLRLADAEIVLEHYELISHRKTPLKFIANFASVLNGFRKTVRFRR
jgi:hypothetical protein